MSFRENFLELRVREERDFFEAASVHSYKYLYIGIYTYIFLNSYKFALIFIIFVISRIYINLVHAMMGKPIVYSWSLF